MSIYLSAIDKAVAELLLASKADSNAKDNLGRTPLQYAAMREDTDMAELLLANGADINARGGAGMMLQKLADTPLHEAALNGRKKIVEFLLTHGADANARDQNGSTPLQMAGGHKDVAELLRQYGGHE